MQIDERLVQQAPASFWRDVFKKPMERPIRKMFYLAYIRSTAWKLRKAERMTLANGTCECCGFASAVEVHHLSYDRLGDEALADMLALCSDCHRAQHDGRPDFLEQVILNKPTLTGATP